MYLVSRNKTIKMNFFLPFFSLVLNYSAVNCGSDLSQNQIEYNKAIYQLENGIQSLKGFIVDTTDDYWTVTDPQGYYSFEGKKRKLSQNNFSEGYFIKMKSF